MSVTTFSFFDDRRSGCVYKLLKLYERPPWWGAGIYRVDVPCDHPDVNLNFVTASVYNDAVQARTLVNKEYTKYEELLCPTVEYAEQCKRYFGLLQDLLLELMIQERSKHEEWCRANPHIDGFSTEVGALRSKIQEFKREQGMLVFNLALYQGMHAHGSRFKFTEYFDFREVQHRYEVASGYFNFLKVHPLSLEPKFAFFNQDHLTVLELIMLAHSKESELGYCLQTKQAHWQVPKCIFLAKWILNEYILAHRELARVEFAVHNMPGGSREGDESELLAEKQGQLLNFVQIKILYLKGLLQSLAAQLPENAKRKKNLRKKAFANFELIIKLSHVGFVNRQALRDEIKVLMYELTIALKSNKAITEEQERLEQQRLEIMEKIAAKSGKIDVGPRLSQYKLMDIRDVPPENIPVQVWPDWLATVVKKWEDANKDSYGRVLFVGEITLHEYERADGTTAVHLPEDREEVAQAEHQASVDQHNLLFDTYVATEDLYHKRAPAGQKYHTLTGSLKVETKPDESMRSQNLALMLCIDTFGHGDLAGSLGTTEWVIEDMRGIIETTDMLDEGDAIGVVKWHPDKEPKPYEAPCWPVVENGVTQTSEIIRDLAPTGGHGIVEGIIQAFKSLVALDAPLMSREIMVITDGFETRPHHQWDNWKKLHTLKQMMDEHNIVVNIYCIGIQTDRYLAKTICNKCGGDYAFSENNTEGKALLKNWVLKRLANQHSKVATDVSVTVKCPKGVLMRIVDNFDTDNAAHTLIGADRARAKPVKQCKASIQKSFRASRKSVRTGRSFKNGSTKQTDVTPYKNLKGDELMVDNMDIINHVLPIQRAWRAHMARARFAFLVDEMMTRIED
mmetsp:Transcript_90467/g.156732  ORF Transcript_90467/g.156732 Transcript_90467/m.156732 type:complete len:850 (+) Transcript_90467:142-2691(+)